MKMLGAGRVTPLPVVFPLLLSLAAFVLAMIALFAGTGSRQQELEEYHIVAINMSGFGKDLLPTETSEEAAPEPTRDGFLGFIDDVGDKADDLKDEITDKVGDALDNAADKLADALGISQWYSFHIMNVCEGDFAPNATEVGAWYNTTNCTAREPGVKFNLTEVINHEIDMGPLNFNTANVELPDAVRQAVDLLNSALFAIFIFYVLGSAFSGLAFLLSIATLALAYRQPGNHRTTVLLNALNAFLGTLTLMIGSAITTAVARKGAAKINDMGDGVGISAIVGRKLITISWVAFGLMCATFLFWTLTCCFPRRDQWDQGRAYAEKPARPSTSSDRGLLRDLFARNR
ncbi:hypothetical protein DL766_009390 [Monosporascus sp. MC13-8B]|uniref:SUR7 protein n=1 Tax=Monosporascus cannonballus TaxID=155416 RepID=A0ABY0GZ77_9PEZI|nr:hypothetical protein DL763_011193 [Monosporascus cannonballus]RYO78138.1 hypothetical protein DL762_008850 [Monosporascus cannonballus]RYP15506.1 hypothetical protein DL766_009390 [Monosporascus sp. MC13-8B]